LQEQAIHAHRHRRHHRQADLRHREESRAFRTIFSFLFFLWAHSNDPIFQMADIANPRSTRKVAVSIHFSPTDSACLSASLDQGEVWNSSSPSLDIEGEDEREMATPDRSPIPPSRNKISVRVEPDISRVRTRRTIKSPIVMMAAWTRLLARFGSLLRNQPFLLSLSRFLFRWAPKTWGEARSFLF